VEKGRGGPGEASPLLKDIASLVLRNLTEPSPPQVSGALGPGQVRGMVEDVKRDSTTALSSVPVHCTVRHTQGPPGWI
jgi:hypothetical protein